MIPALRLPCTYEKQSKNIQRKPMVENQFIKASDLLVSRYRASSIELRYVENNADKRSGKDLRSYL